MKLRVIKTLDDHASRLKLGDIVQVSEKALTDYDVVNIGGGHYLVKEIWDYFEKTAMDPHMKNKMEKLYPVNEYDPIYSELLLSRNQSIQNDLKREGFEAAVELIEAEKVAFRASECEAHIHPDPAKRLTHERYLVQALDRIQELQGALEYATDDYVKAVGTWKIVQRLEEQVKRLTENLETATKALDYIGERIEAGLDGMYGHQSVTPQEHCYEMQEEYLAVYKEAKEKIEENQ